MDIRNRKLAEIIVTHSCKIAPGEKVLIEARGLESTPLVDEIIKAVYRAGGLPFTNVFSETTLREILQGATEEQLQFMARLEVNRMKEMDAFVGITAHGNYSELSDVPQSQMSLYQKLYSKPVSDIRVPHTKWVVLRYPTSAMAQCARMSSYAFQDFYYDVCCVDYQKMGLAMDPLKDLMLATDRVHITGPGTDLEFSIKNIPVIKCAGESNIPDGEVYTAPVRDSVNGYVTYNTPSEYQGFTYTDVRLEFEKGKIVKATANDTERINQVFDTDEGARYVGEFALGVNPSITSPMKNILFDEKIMGSFHFTPGQAYDEACNGNKSAIHWDLVCIQTPEYGGGEIWFDGKLVRKDGRFVMRELEGLNPERLR